MSDPGKLDDCHACDVPEPTPISNRPGLPALAYRAGTWATFRDDMLVDLGGQPALAGLTTRAPDDPAIALIDAWAVVGDILTFYQERIANEGYLRTATERRSVLELARQIGYELGAGVAASTPLAFQVEQSLVPNAGLPIPSTIVIGAGAKVQSVPGQNEMPQTFETTADIEARAAWNVMVPKATQRQRLGIYPANSAPIRRVDPAGGAPKAATSLYVNGIGTNVRVGDVIVVRVTAKNLVGDWLSPKTGTVCMYVTGVVPDYAAKTTRLDLAQDGAPDPKWSISLAPAEGTPDTPVVKMTPQSVRALILEQHWTEENLLAFLEVQDWDPDKLVEQVARLIAHQPPPAEIFAFRTKTGVFGHAAPPFVSLARAYLPGTPPWNNYERRTIWENSILTKWSKLYQADIFLDRVVQGVARRGWAALVRGGKTTDLPTPYQIEHVSESSLSDFAISGKATGLALSDANATDLATGRITNAQKPDWWMRRTTVYCQSEPLDVIDAPIAEPFMKSNGGIEVTLDRMVLGLYAGQRVCWTGMTLDETTNLPSGSTASEIRTIVGARHNRGYTIVQIDRLEHSYVRNTVTINGNVAPATHGFTVANELLGSGDGSQIRQTFTLRTAPLTYVSAATPSGSESTLVVRVGGVQWTEVRTLYAAGPNDRVFVTRQQPDGTTTIMFGDGIHGARLPSGRNNVTATYRMGTGPDGQIKAGKLAILASKPLGVKAAVNPLPATGAEGPEQLSGARVNAPRTVRTLDRLVSLTDFEDFARGFAGVGKVQAVPLWNGEIQSVHLTLGDALGQPMITDHGSGPADNLRLGIQNASDGRHTVELGGYIPAFFKLELSVVVDPAYVIEKVVRDVTMAIRSTFVYAKRDLGQAVTEAEIILLVQARAGVIATAISALYNAKEPPALFGVIPAAGAHFVDGKIVPAELLLLHRVGLKVTGAHG